MKDYEVTITESSKDLTTREKIKLKDLSICKQLDQLTAEDDVVIIDVDYYVEFAVHNEKARDKDYTKIVIVDKDGTRYITGSDTFRRSLTDIADDLAEAGELDDFKIRVYRKPSKNYAGKDFLTCSLD